MFPNRIEVVGRLKRAYEHHADIMCHLSRMRPLNTLELLDFPTALNRGLQALELYAVDLSINQN